eukprot:SAG31_NODE_6439_length_2018_cov_2.608650_3_plen_138_part_00
MHPGGCHSDSPWSVRAVCWIGLHRVEGRTESDGWQWNDDPATLAYENWQCWTANDCEPNNGGAEDAAVMNYWGYEPHKLCSTLRTNIYVGILLLLVSLGIMGVGFLGIHTFNAQFLDIHWIALGETLLFSHAHLVKR